MKRFVLTGLTVALLSFAAPRLADAGGVNVAVGIGFPLPIPVPLPRVAVVATPPYGYYAPPYYGRPVHYRSYAPRPVYYPHRHHRRCHHRYW